MRTCGGCAGTNGEELVAAVEPYNLMWPTGHVGSVGVAGQSFQLPKPLQLRA